MKKYTGFAIFTAIALLTSVIPTSYAASTVNVSTEKDVFSYGDYLTFTIEVSEVLETPAIVHIIDDSGKRGSAIPIPIYQQTTIVPSPFPFESLIYPLGNYTIEVQYANVTSTTEFELIDTGKTVIPFWMKKFLIPFYLDGEISDEEFTAGIEFLIKEDIIKIPETENGEKSKPKVPNWLKKNTQWWVEKKISDDEYVNSIQYLVKIGAITV